MNAYDLATILADKDMSDDAHWCAEQVEAAHYDADLVDCEWHTDEIMERLECDLDTAHAVSFAYGEALVDAVRAWRRRRTA